MKISVHVNLNAQYDLPDWAGHKVQIFGGISNLFDKDPVVNPSAQGSGNLAFSDPYGRAFKIGFRLRQ